MSSTLPVKVTVLMTLYNKQDFVLEAVRSILDGSFQDLELLIVDDASTDGSLRAVEGIDDPRVRIVRNERNSGRAATANRGYDEARGEYIAILDADDVAHPDRLERQVAFMDAHPEVGVCGTAARQFGGADDVQHWPATDRECRARMMFTDPVLYGSSIIRASVLRDTGIRSNGSWRLPGEDYLFMVALSGHTRFANLPEVLLNYRIGPQNQRHGRDAFSDRRAVCAEFFRSMGLNVTERELDLHMLFYLLSREALTGGDIKGFHAWKGRLEGMVEEKGLCDMSEFRKLAEQRWARLYFLAADHGVVPAITHLFLSRAIPFNKLGYLVKVTFAPRSIPG